MGSRAASVRLTRNQRTALRYVAGGYADEKVQRMHYRCTHKDGRRRHGVLQTLASLRLKKLLGWTQAEGYTITDAGRACL